MIDDIRPPKRYDTSYAKLSTDRDGGEEVEMPEPAFHPPSSRFDDEVVIEPPDPQKPKKKGKGFSTSLQSKLKKLSKKQWAIIGVVSLMVLGGISVFAFRREPAPLPEPVAKVEPTPEPPPPTTTPSRLSGVEVPIEMDKLPVTGVMIENSPDARPQSGLKDAGVVVEAIAEGGITRFLALFQTEQPDYIGPVRSVRPYYLDFLVPFDAAIAHAGGSGQALAEISHQGIKDLDHGANPSIFHRVGGRYAPHNLYTSRAELLAAQKAKGWETSNFSGFVRKAEQPSAAPTARTIDFRISGFLYDAHFDYDPVGNRYNRSMAGQNHINERGGAQISPKVVVALVMPHRYEGIYSVYGTVGSGKAYIFQDGTVTEGMWEKASRQSQLKFGDANGAPLGLNPGQTWITLVGAYTDVRAVP